MDRVRLSLAALAALAACRASEAGSTSGLVAPTGWRPLPELVTAAGDAAAHAKITVDGIEAWGEPARGCYAAWLAVRGSAGAPAKLAEPLLASLTVDVPGLTLDEVSKPAATGDAGVLSLAFTRAPYRGRIRAQLDKTGAITALACYWNQREPAACDAACTAMIGAMK